MQQEVGQVALGVHEDGRDALQGGFFQHNHRQAGLAGAGHPGDHGVGGQIVRVIKDLVFPHLALLQVIFLAKEKFIGFTGHRASCWVWMVLVYNMTVQGRASFYSAQFQTSSH